MKQFNISLDTAVINDCGVIELGIASELHSIECFSHIDLRQAQ